MRFSLKQIFISFIVVILSSFSLTGQNSYAPQVEIISQVNAYVAEQKADEALSLLNQNKDLFQYDAITQFWHNWLNGVILYRIDKYSEARPFIADAISYLDDNQNELSDPNYTRFLQVYYYAQDINFKLGADKDEIIKGLEHAKHIYEIANATSDVVYSWITESLGSIKSRDFDMDMEAYNLYLARDFQNAIPYILKIIDNYKKNRADEYLNIANWLKALGTSYMNIGDYNNSEKTYKSALELLESHNIKDEEIYRAVLDALSVLYCQLHNYEKALSFNNNAKTLYEQSLDFGTNYVACMSNSALCHLGLGHKTTAKLILNVALRKAKELLSDTTKISSYFTELNQFTKREFDAKTMDKNFYIYSHILPYITLLSNASAIYSELGYFSDAIHSIKESIEISEKYGLSYALQYHNLATLYFRKSKFSKSVEWFLKSYELCKTPFERDEIGINTALGLYLSQDTTASTFSSRLTAKMRKNIPDMFTFMSGSERAIYWKHYENSFPILNHIIYESGKLELFGSIYDNILEAKGLLLRSTNAIRDAIMMSGNKDDIGDFTRLCFLKQQMLIEKEDGKRFLLRNEIERLDKNLTQRVNSYAVLATSKRINWENVRDALSAEDVAIEFYNIPVLWGLDSVQIIDGEPRYCALVLKKEYAYPHIIPLCKESELDKFNRDYFYDSDIIYKNIWQPLEQELKGVKNIYFAADLELHKIGIEYAPISDTENIGDRYNIYRLSSTRLLAEGKAGRRDKTAVLYGGLKYDLEKDELIAESRSGNYHPTSTSRAFSETNLRYGVKYLEKTLPEIEAIASFFPNPPRLVTGISGTEESFKALSGSSTDIIHLATHGFFWSEEVAKKREYATFLKTLKHDGQTEEDQALTRSGLIFSGANIGLDGVTLPDDVEDGVLTALELSNMNLGNVDMVVMSACQSGLGETTGEGVFGLQRGFKLAGANTLLMSLWKVEDEATQLLMTEFYKHYLSGKSKQESLRLAQKALRNGPKYSEPKYWAAFILLDGLN